MNPTRAKALAAEEIDADAFWSKVAVTDDSSECWEWQGYRTRKGYGHVRQNYRRFMTHRAAVALTQGHLAEAAHVCHHCDNPPCCNPSHLYVGDNSSNQRDLVERGGHWLAKRSTCDYGHPFTPDNIRRRSGRPGARLCATCDRARQKVSQARIRARKRAEKGRAA